LKIGPHLPKLLSNIKWLLFLATVYIVFVNCDVIQFSTYYGKFLNWLRTSCVVVSITTVDTPGFDTDHCWTVAYRQHFDGGV